MRPQEWDFSEKEGMEMKNFIIKSLVISLSALSFPVSLHAARGAEVQAPPPPSFPDTTPPSNSSEEETDVPSSGAETSGATPAQGGGLVAQAQNAANAMANHVADHPIPYAVKGAVLGTGALVAAGVGAYGIKKVMKWKGFAKKRERMVREAEEEKKKQGVEEEGKKELEKEEKKEKIKTFEKDWAEKQEDFINGKYQLDGIRVFFAARGYGEEGLTKLMAKFKDEAKERRKDHLKNHLLEEFKNNPSLLVPGTSRNGLMRALIGNLDTAGFDAEERKTISNQVLKEAKEEVARTRREKEAAVLSKFLKTLPDYPQELSSSSVNELRGASKKSLLHHAIKKNNLEALNALLKYPGIDREIKNRNGETPLAYAVRSKTPQEFFIKYKKEGDPKDLSSLKALIKAGADLNSRNKNQDGSINVTPLMIAMYSVPDVSKVLIEAGADPHLKDSRGWTILNHAISAQNRDLVQLLLQRKDISLNHQTLASKSTPFQMAETIGLTKIAEDLKEAEDLRKKDGQQTTDNKEKGGEKKEKEKKKLEENEKIVVDEKKEKVKGKEKEGEKEKKATDSPVLPNRAKTVIDEESIWKNNGGYEKRLEEIRGFYETVKKYKGVELENAVSAFKEKKKEERKKELLKQYENLRLGMRTEKLKKDLLTAGFSEKESTDIVGTASKARNLKRAEKEAEKLRGKSWAAGDAPEEIQKKVKGLYIEGKYTLKGIEEFYRGRVSNDQELAVLMEKFKKEIKKERKNFLLKKFKDPSEFSLMKTKKLEKKLNEAGFSEKKSTNIADTALKAREADAQAKLKKEQFVQGNDDFVNRNKNKEKVVGEGSLRQTKKPAAGGGPSSMQERLKQDREKTIEVQKRFGERSSSEVKNIPTEVKNLPAGKGKEVKPKREEIIPYRQLHGNKIAAKSNPDYKLSFSQSLISQEQRVKNKGVF
jgi:hypothetical protein